MTACKKGSHVLLEDVPDNAIFTINRGRIFRKGPQLRKRFKCLDLNNHRHYLISPIAEVELVPEQLVAPQRKEKSKNKGIQLGLFG